MQCNIMQYNALYDAIQYNIVKCNVSLDYLSGAIVGRYLEPSLEEISLSGIIIPLSDAQSVRFPAYNWPWRQQETRVTAE